MLDFPREQMPQVRRLLEEYQDRRTIYRFGSREEAAAFLAQLESNSL